MILLGYLIKCFGLHDLGSIFYFKVDYARDS
jgi:hypothetical protein